MRAIVLADGDPPTRAGLDVAWPGWDSPVDLVVAADGGARLAAELGLRVDRWVGDGDSVEPGTLDALRVAGVVVEVASPDKDDSDTELAIVAAVEAGATEITILGGLGRRIDHELANLALLAHPRLHGRRAELCAPDARVRLLDGPGRLDLAGPAGGVVSLLPMGDRVEGVVTEGLRYPLRDETLELGPARGLSNVRTAPHARVTIRSGRLLVIETPATVGR